MIIRKEAPEDSAAIRHVNEAAFEGSAEADIVEKLRLRQADTISLVAAGGDRVIGHILFPPVAIESGKTAFSALGLGPMSVLPSYQRKGVGSQLVQAGLEECRRLGHEIVVVLGHPDYYPRFGFIPAKPKGLKCEFEVPDEAWMLLELEEGALAGRSGVAKYPPEFSEA